MKFCNHLLHRHLSQWTLTALLLIVAGCSSVPERHALPPEHTLAAVIPGIPDEARFWGDESPVYQENDLDSMTDAELRRVFPDTYESPHHYLAISGGGSNGAFGAGLLLGWSAAGTRPEFTMVTGVSTGALTAPFAFLGEAYDARLKNLYTNTSTSQIVIKRNLLTALLGDSIADTSPLRNLIAEQIDDTLIDAIARAHSRGRRLFIGTMNLDAGRSVIWNIGAIANSSHPGKSALIHDIMLASASIPVAFPPVIIKVDVAGKSYDELHVDGGTGSQVFVYPAALNWRFITKKLRVRGKPKVYVLRNSFLEPDYQGIKRNVIPIASRTIDSLIRTQGIGDLYQIYAICQRDGNEFNLAYIPSDFTDKPAEVFDPVYMGKLFQRGYDMAIDGYNWQKAPPDFLAGS